MHGHHIHDVGGIQLSQESLISYIIFVNSYVFFLNIIKSFITLIAKI